MIHPNINKKEMSSNGLEYKSEYEKNSFAA